MTPNLDPRSGDCVCGVAVALHYDARSRRLTCDQVAQRVGLETPLVDEQPPTSVPFLPSPARRLFRVLTFPTDLTAFRAKRASCDQ